MDASQFGPFANIIAIASALVSMFSVLMLKMLGRLRRWTWLIEDTPSFLVTAGPRAVAVALMGAAYLLIDSSNYGWFIGAAVLCGLLALWSIKRFDNLRRRYVIQVPIVTTSGRHMTDGEGEKVYENVVVGPEDDMKPTAAEHFQKARKEHGVSLIEFMSGYGSSQLYDPGALWKRDELADIAHRLAGSLVYVVLSCVMAIFLVSLALDVAG